MTSSGFKLKSSMTSLATLMKVSPMIRRLSSGSETWHKSGVFRGGVTSFTVVSPFRNSRDAGTTLTLRPILSRLSRTCNDVVNHWILIWNEHITWLILSYVNKVAALSIYQLRLKIANFDNRDTESVVFNSGQKMALRVAYTVIC